MITKKNVITSIFSPFAIFVIAQLSAVQLRAQNPGFEGKHLSVYGMYDASFALRTVASIYTYGDHGVEPSVGAYGVEVTPGLGMEYTFSTSVTAGVNARFIKSEIPFSAFYRSENIRDLQAYCGETISSGIFMGIYLKYYRFEKKGMLAPVGRYHQFELITGTSEYQTGKVYSQDRELLQDFMDDYPVVPYHITDNVESLDLGRYRQTFVRYTVGEETVVFNNVPIDLGIQFSLPAAVLTGFTSFRYNNYEQVLYENLLFGTYSAFMLGITTKVGLFAF